jgi:DNA-binding response OmpR family regulator
MSSTLQRITWIEDAPDIRTVGEISLGQIGGFTLDLCASGEEALVRTAAFNPDLIILDVMMPGMDGIETYKRLRKIPSLENTPIIFLTAKAMSNEIVVYRSLGAAAVIAKPFDPLALPERLRGIWRKIMGDRSPPVQDQLRALLRTHCAALNEQIGTVGDLLDEGLSAKDGKAFDNALSLTRQIKGDSGSLGYPELAAAAASLGENLRRLADESSLPISETLARESRNLFLQLKAAATASTPERSTLYDTAIPSDFLYNFDSVRY